MDIAEAFHKLERSMAGWPDTFLTWALLLGAGVIVWIALTQKPMAKAVALSYIVFP